MILKFPHIGDIHLGANTEREADRLRALDQIIDECIGMPELGAWLVPGDIFDHSSTIAVRNALKDRVRRMAMAAPVIGCRGNHDADGDLDIFADLDSEFPIYFPARPEIKTFMAANGTTRVNVFALPYPTGAGYLAAGVSGVDIPKLANAAMDQLFMDMGHRLTQARDKGELVLMIGHVDVVGSRRSVGQPSVGEESIALNQSMLDRLPHCYKGLNHIHMAQVVGSADYAGSICRLTWGEIEPKIYKVAVYDDRTYWEAESHPVDVAPMWHLECDLTREGVQNLAAVAGPDGQRPSWPGMRHLTDCEVRLRARYRQSEGIVLAEAERDARDMFEHVLRFEFEPVCEPDRAVRAPAVVAAVTLQDKIKAWADVTGVVLPESVATKLIRLETVDGAILVAEEEQRLQRLRTPAATPPGGNGEGPVVLDNSAEGALTLPPVAEPPGARDKQLQSNAVAGASPEPGVGSGFTPVTSSNLLAVKWDQQVLLVEFHDHVIWTYGNVTHAQYDEMLAAPSIGKYFSKTIKAFPKKHPATKMYDPKESSLFTEKSAWMSRPRP